MKNYLFGPLNVSTASRRLSLGLLFLRVIFGIAMMAHGYSKIMNPMAWMGPEAPVPGILQALAAIAEFGGGLALILGLLTSLAALGMIVTMAVAVFFHVSKGDAFVGGYETALVYLAISILIFCAGPGSYSADAMILKKSGPKSNR